MTALWVYRRSVLVLAFGATVWLSAGCSRLVPLRHKSVQSTEIVVDTRQDPSEALSGFVIPEVLPAVTIWPVVFAEKIPADAIFTDATCETVSQTGEPLSAVQTMLRDNHVYVKFAVSKADSVAQAHLVVHANYQYRW
jgi:hypothetical protein